MKQTALQILEVSNKSDLEKFITLPWEIFKEDPNWVPPLLMERRDALNADKNPYFQHAEVKLWLACQNGKPVGRISAQVDQLVPKTHGIKTGHFGFFDCFEDQAIANALLDVAFEWLKSKGMVEIIGPFSLSINEETGMLVDGFDTPPSLMMGHAMPYYQTLIENYGLTKIKDVWAYYLDITKEALPPAIDKLVKRSLDNPAITLRKINMKNYEQDLKTILDIFNDAWTENWKFLPFTEAELNHAVKEMKLLIREDFTYIAEVDGVPQAMMVTLPNLNEIIADFNGRLLPFNIFKLLWRLKIKPDYKTVRVPLMGVRKDMQNSRIGGALAFALIEKCRENAIKAGCTHAELSWVLEENTRLSKMLETIGCWKYKTYRLFSQKL